MSLRAVVTGRFIGGALRTPRQGQEDKAPKYSSVVVLDAGQEKKIEDLVKQGIAEKWNGKQPPGFQNWALRVGDDPEMASFEQHYINPKSNGVDKYGEVMKAPGMFVKKGGVINALEKDNDVIYPGCYVAVEVDLYAYEGDKTKNIKPGVTLGFNKVLFLKDGPRLTNQTSAEDAFADFDSADGMEDLGFGS